MSQKIEDMCHRYNALKGSRGNWETHWEEIAERVLPRQVGFLGARADGEKKSQKPQNATLTYSGNLHGFTQDQLDFIVEYVAAHTSKLYINAITGDVEYLINLGN